jgi:hypothetical protein
LFEAGAGKAPAPEEIQTSLQKMFQTRFDLSLDQGSLTMEERALLATNIPEMRTETWTHSLRLPTGIVSEASTRGSSATVHATVVHGQERNRISQVLFTGDFCSHPLSAIQELENELANSPIDEAPARIENTFTKTGAEIIGATAADFFTALSLAFMKRRVELSTAMDPLYWKKEVRT